MKISSKQHGNAFERSFCEMLFSKGFWVHNFVQNSDGQPADVIAVKNGAAYLIDCKVCSGDSFKFSRIEDNQTLAMELWRGSGNGNAWFAILIQGNIYMIPHTTLMVLSRIRSSLHVTELESWGTKLGEWVESCK